MGMLHMLHYLQNGYVALSSIWVCCICYIIFKIEYYSVNMLLDTLCISTLYSKEYDLELLKSFYYHMAKTDQIANAAVLEAYKYDLGWGNRYVYSF